MRQILLIAGLAVALSACGVKSPLIKPGEKPAKQQSEERDPSMPPQPLGK